MTKIKRTLTVLYASGESVEVNRAKGAKWDDLTVLLKDLFTQFLTKKGYLGELLHPDNEASWGNLQRLCSLLPLAGAEGEFLDLEKLDRDDWEALCTLFFTTTDTMDEETGCILPEDSDKTYSPGRIAKFHGIDFFERILVPAVEANAAIFKQKQEELQARTKAVAEEAAATEVVTEPKAVVTEPIPIPMTKAKRQRSA